MNCPYNVGGPFSGGTCLSRPFFFGGTCSSGPPYNVRSSIAFHRGLKSHAESGAKAPHSIRCGDLWSAAIYRRFSVKALAFTSLGAGPDGNGVPVGVEPDPAIRATERRFPLARPRQACPLRFTGRCERSPSKGLEGLSPLEGPVPPGRWDCHVSHRGAPIQSFPSTPAFFTVTASPVAAGLVSGGATPTMLPVIEG
jgi:hypothetical protein